MRVLMAITSFLPSHMYGGPATVALSLGRALVRNRHEVTIITSNILSMRPKRNIETNHNVLDGVRVLYFPTQMYLRRFPTFVSRSLKRWIQEHIHEYEIVHVHFARDWIPLTVAKEAIRQRIPLVLQSHGMLGRRTVVRNMVDHLVTKRILKRADIVFALQHTEETEIKEIAPRAHTAILPNGIEVLPNADRWDVSALSNRIVLFVARLHPIKRILHLLDAVYLLRRDGFVVRLRIVGPDDGDMQQLLERISAYSMEQVVDITGALPPEETRREYAKASVFVLPSIREYFPMSVLEALSVGTPVIVSSGVHIHDTLVSHNAALAVPSDSQQLASAIRKILTDPELATTLSANAVNIVRHEYALTHVIDRLEKAYARIAIKNSRATNKMTPVS